jgi:hypothetical protein
VKAP